MRAQWVNLSLFCLILSWVVSVRAQSPSALAPLRTEVAAPVGDGIAEASLAFVYQRNERFPFFTTPGAIRTQDRIHLPVLRFRAGVGSRVEIDAQHEMIYLDETTRDGLSNWQYGTGDAQLHTKVAVVKEQGLVPAISVRFGTKLPNASRVDRLGTDETDFDILALLSKDLGTVSLHTNLGIALLGNPGSSPLPGAFEAGGQDDLFVYSVALASRPWAVWGQEAPALRWVLEFDGTTGSRFGNDRSRWSAGVRWEHLGWSYFFGGSAGLTRGSEDFGLGLGLAYRWDLGALLRGP